MLQIQQLHKNINIQSGTYKFTAVDFPHGSFNYKIKCSFT